MLILYVYNTILFIYIYIYICGRAGIRAPLDFQALWLRAIPYLYCGTKCQIKHKSGNITLRYTDVSDLPLKRLKRNPSLHRYRKPFL